MKTSDCSRPHPWLRRLLRPRVRSRVNRSPAARQDCTSPTETSVAGPSRQLDPKRALRDDRWLCGANAVRSSHCTGELDVSHFLLEELDHVYKKYAIFPGVGAGAQLARPKLGMWYQRASY